MFPLSERVILFVDGLYFHSTYSLECKSVAEQVIHNFAAYNKIMTMRDYGVAIYTANPKTNEVISWNKVPGYSLWE